jgi:phage-related protein
MQKWNGTTASVNANHEKAAAAIQTAQVNLQKYQQELDQLTNTQGLAGGSVADTTAQFEAAARANTNLGFTVADSANALQFLFATTNNVPETMGAYQDAMDLARAKNIDLATASNLVIQAMSGQGRGLRDLGVNVADGLSGQTALAAIQDKVKGAAQDAATQGLGPYTVATANMNKAMADFGTTVLPMLASFLEDVTAVITKVDAWAQAHPKLAEALLVFLGLLGGLLILVGAILVPFGLLIIGIEAFSTAVAALGVTMFAAIGWTLLYMAAIAAIVAIVALIIVYHKQIMDAIEAAWNWIIDHVSNWMLELYNDFTTWGTGVTKWWDDLWNGVYSTLEAVWGKIQTIINSILSAISKVTGGVSGIAGAIGSTVSGAVGGVIHAFASGGIVNGPTLALVGEAGPEAIIPLSAFAGGSSLAGVGGGSGGGNIIVNINGGNYLDSNGATMIANALATQIQRQIRLKNYT